VGDPRPVWKLAEFLPRLDAWITRERPADFQRIAATAWVLGRADDPFQGVQRAEGFDDLWYGAIPDTLDARGRVVVGSYFVDPAARTVTCESFSILGWPV
jgi:hypothetical protein